MASQLSICHVITRMIVGGAQENTLYTIRGHLERGHKVTLITGPSDGPEGSLLDNLAPPGMELVEIPEMIRAISPWKDWQAYRRLQQFFRQNAFDVVHTHSSKAGVIGRAAAFDAKVPFVCHTVHGQAFHPYQSWWKNQLYIQAERFAAKRCHRIYAVAQAMIDQCVAAKVAPKEKYQVVYSGMDLGSFRDAKRDMALRQKLGIPADAPVVGIVARLFELKGHDALIDAAPAIIQQFPETRFLLVGDGILRKHLETRIAQAGLTKNFVFAGLVPPEQVPAYIAQMDILVHLSLREGLPRACVQGLAAAVPVVALPLDGTPEVVLHGKTGFLAETGSNTPATAAKAIIQLLESAELRRQMGQCGQELVLQRFDWHRMADILEEEYYHGLALNR